MTSPERAPPCIVLAGGFGTRLRTVLPDLPKCLAPVGNRPFLDLLVGRLVEAGIEDIILSLGHLSGLVIEAIRANPHRTLPRYVVEPRPLGTGGAVAHVLDTFGLDEVLVVNGDTWLDGDLAPILAPLDRRGGELFRLAAVAVVDRSRFGGLRTDETGLVREFLEKGQSSPGLINAGLYRLCADALEPRGRESFSLEQDILPPLVAAHSVRVALVAGEFIDIGVPEDYHRFIELHG